MGRPTNFKPESSGWLFKSLLAAAGHTVVAALQAAYLVYRSDAHPSTEGITASVIRMSDQYYYYRAMPCCVGGMYPDS